jgi:hypothetical protein
VCFAATERRRSFLLGYGELFVRSKPFIRAGLVGGMRALRDLHR